MRLAIDLDRQPGARAIEVEHVIVRCVLLAEA
jgi:hypothetical protein